VRITEKREENVRICLHISDNQRSNQSSVCRSCLLQYASHKLRTLRLVIYSSGRIPANQQKVQNR
jgi:hypothetical protein